MKKGTIIILSGGLLAFYLVIITYIFFAVLHIETLANFEAGVIFELIGFLLLSYFVLSNLCSKRIKAGFFVSLVMVTVIYTVILDVINMVCIVTMPHSLFVLLNFILLFLYCLISMPMFVMGKR